MAVLLLHRWWAVAARGMLSLLIALLVLVWPRGTSAPLLALLGVYALVDGLLCLLLAFGSIQQRRWSVALLASACAGLLAGFVDLGGLRLRDVMGLQLLAGWPLIIGLVTIQCGLALQQTTPGPRVVLELGTGLRFRRVGQREWGLLLAGLAAVALGTILLFASGENLRALVPLLGLFAAVFGYLHLRVGLSLGALALSGHSSSMDPAARGTGAEDAGEWRV